MKRKKYKIRSAAILSDLQKETIQGVAAVIFFALFVFFLLSAFGSAGIVGDTVYKLLSYLLGVGYFIVPLLLFILSIAMFTSVKRHMGISKIVGAILFFISGLGLIDIILKDSGGVAGGIISKPLIILVDIYAATIILIAILTASLLIIFDTRPRLLSLNFLSKSRSNRTSWNENNVADNNEKYVEDNADNVSDKDTDRSTVNADSGLLGKLRHFKDSLSEEEFSPIANPAMGIYNPPPISLLERDRGKPGVGDTKANANIIKRTLQNFGINVEMDEVSVGPTVTRYALKPAEGVRISKIVALQNNLELALAAHPVRIEAPIPGKSLVGIEVPNTSKTTLGLASLLSKDEFTQSKKSLLLALGRDIAGTPHYADLSRMPHLLIAGATGAGKSVAIHGIITSLLFRNAPEILRLIMIDPKRVELTMYRNIPHLLTPVITDAKQTILSLKWAAKEMDRRYDIFEAESVRDINSYHANILAPALKKRKHGETPQVESMPYIVIIIDELADIMQAYPRELESAVVRIAQMSRAVGIHLIMSTQRPSVNIITGLIKANIPARIALQVSSQVDSRTILDAGGAEKLLGAGDMLFLSGEMSKPLRIQAPFISEIEVKKVAKPGWDIQLYIDDTLCNTF